MPVLSTFNVDIATISLTYLADVVVICEIGAFVEVDSKDAHGSDCLLDAGSADG